MFVDLDDHVNRFLVQEYINKIVNAKSDMELSYDVHKLIHTFEVVKMARELVNLSNLNDTEKQTIIQAATLHDVGRCYEFKDGRKVSPCDHGKMGASIIQRAFPEMEIAIKSTELHNKLPNSTEPEWVYPVLGYVRDADMLGNIAYQIDHMPLFLDHIRECYPASDDLGYVQDDIKNNVAQRHIQPSPQYLKSDLMNMLLNQVCWIFVLYTQSACQIAKEQRLFTKMRDVLIRQVIPVMAISEDKKQTLKDEILSVFPDSLFEEEFKKHGL